MARDIDPACSRVLPCEVRCDRGDAIAVDEDVCGECFFPTAVPDLAAVEQNCVSHRWHSMESIFTGWYRSGDHAAGEPNTGIREIDWSW
jgi:hypothetical protein